MAHNNSRRTSGLKILQLNGGRGRKVSSELRAYVDEESIDALMLQEPYNIGGRVGSFGIGSQIITGGREGKTSWAAIVVFNPDLTIMKLDHLSDDHIVCVQFSCEIDPYIEKIRKILIALRGQKVILGIDANAESPLWFSENLNQRGRKLEDLIAEMGLFVCNERSTLYTFSGVNGESNIDVTLTSETALREIRSWEVKEGWTSSDHNVIVIELEVPEYSRNEREKLLRYLVDKANWEVFDGTLKTIMEGYTVRESTNASDVVRLARDIRDVLKRASDAAIPRKGRRKIGTKWWKPELTKLKRRVYRSRRKAQKEKKLKRGSYEEYHLQYYNVKRSYDIRLNITRNTSWREYVTKASTDPWGFAYKLACQRLRTHTVLSSIQCNTGPTTHWKDAADALLDSFFPNDETDEDDFEHTLLRNEMYEPGKEEREEPLFTALEITAILRKMKTNKAPGWDSIEVLVVKKAFKHMESELVSLFNGCLNIGIIPNEWKRSCIVTLLKSPDKDPMRPNSYRPICLLPVLGKVLEGLILNRIQPRIEANLFDSQYGFRNGRSTEDALQKLLGNIEKSKSKYVMGIFLDIKGAFNNLWWPDIIHSLKEAGCSNKIIALIQDYLRNRTVIIRNKTGQVIREVNKGCPQGSLVGPSMWNIVFDGLLRKLEETGYVVAAYADDGAILVEGNTRKILQERGQTAINIVDNWCTAHKMELSTDKTVMMMLKGALDMVRPPKVLLKGKQVKMVQEFQYLGITLASGITGVKIGKHIEKISIKSKNLFNGIRRIAKKEWGLGFRALRIVYNGLFVAIVTYGIAAWGHMPNTRHWRTLQYAQRHALIGVTRAYRTVSAEAVQVIAGVLPIKLEAERRMRAVQIRKGVNFKIGNWTYQPNVDGGETNRQKKRLQTEAGKKVLSDLLDRWQSEWDNADKGRATYEFFPNIRNRLQYNWIMANYHTSQLLTGHGNFKEKLKSMNLTNSGNCQCGEPDTHRHVILQCHRWDTERNIYAGFLESKGIILNIGEHLMAKEIYKEFEIFAVTTLKKKEYEDNRLRE